MARTHRGDGGEAGSELGGRGGAAGGERPAPGVHDPAAEPEPEEPGADPGPGGPAQGCTEDLHQQHPGGTQEQKCFLVIVGLLMLVARW